MQLAIFLFTLFFIFTKPFNLKLGTISFIGAIIALLCGYVSLENAIEISFLIKNAMITFFALIALSFIFEKNNSFEFYATKIFSQNKSYFSFFISMLIFTTFLSIIFANDGAILVITPILLAIINMNKIGIKQATALLLSASFMCDAASSFLVTSNLTNIITTNYFDINFTNFFKDMFFPSLISVVLSIIFLYIYFKKDLKLEFNIVKTSSLKDNKFFIISNLTVFIALFFSFLGFNVALCFSMAAVFLLIIGKNLYKFKEFISTLPYQIVIFCFSIYILVFSLKNAGYGEILENFISQIQTISSTLAIISTSFISAVLSSLFNNLPSVTFINLSLENLENQKLIYANLLGSNLGTKLSPLGSLSTLLWLHILEKNSLKISIREFIKCGFTITFIVLFYSSIAIAL